MCCKLLMLKNMENLYSETYRTDLEKRSSNVILQMPLGF